MELIFAHTSDDLKLPGFHYQVEKKDLCVLFIPGMSGFILENYFGHVLGVKLQEQGIGYLFTHTRGYAHINDIRTSELNPDGSFKSQRNGAMYERFEGCVPDIEAWLQTGREMGYQKFVIIGHSLGGPKVVHHFYKNRPQDMVGVILLSPADMVGLVQKPGNQPDYQQLLEEARDNVQKGEPEKLLSGKVWHWYVLSSQTFLDLFEVNGPADVLPLFRNPETFPEFAAINAPMLCIMGEHDDIAIRSLDEDMKLLKQKATSTPSFETVLLPGASHGYDGKESQLAEQVLEWVKSRFRR